MAEFDRLPSLPAGVGPTEEHVRVFEAYRRELGVPDRELPLTTAAVNRAVDWWSAGAPDLDHDGGERA